MALFAVAAFLLFLIQCLRLFDLVSGKGQSIVTLVGQALLGMPGLAHGFPLCLPGHRPRPGAAEPAGEQRTRRSSIATAWCRRCCGPSRSTSLGGAAVVLLLSHVLDPLGVRSTNDWSQSIAADLVSRSMIPHRFTALGGGVSMVIGGRDSQGNITDFFADDPRDPDSHRTYFAKSAIITHDEQGYVLRMHDGAVQYLTADRRFSQIAFQQYDLPMDRLSGDASSADPISLTPSYDLIGQALATGVWDPDVVKAAAQAHRRRVSACSPSAALSPAFAMFPNGARRREGLPIEITVLVAAFVERTVTSYLVGPGILGVASGSS